jgi:hypothetical protein
MGVNQALELGLDRHALLLTSAQRDAESWLASKVVPSSSLDRHLGQRTAPRLGLNSIDTLSRSAFMRGSG